MNGKQHPIEILEKALKCEKNYLDNNRNHIRSLEKEIAVAQQYTVKNEARIAWLKDAIYKLKGLANLEDKNNLPDPSGVRPLQHWEKMAQDFEM